MNRQASRAIAEKLKSIRCKKWYHRVCVSLAAVVVFCTVYALILPAITQEHAKAADIVVTAPYINYNDAINDNLITDGTANINNCILAYNPSGGTFEAFKSTLSGTACGSFAKAGSYALYQAITVAPDANGNLKVGTVKSGAATGLSDYSSYSKNNMSMPTDGFILFIRTNGYDLSVADCYVTVNKDWKKSTPDSNAGITITFSTTAPGASGKEDKNNKLVPINNAAKTAEFITLNLFNYGDKINTKYYTNPNLYPGFQQDGGSTMQSGGIYQTNFGNTITADPGAGITQIANADNKNINGMSNRSNSPIRLSETEGDKGSAMSRRLGENGYPQTATGGDLSYLFSTNEENSVTKINTQNLDGLFQYNEESGLYYFDSRENHAQYNSAEDKFDLYDQKITGNFIWYPYGNFLPFENINTKSKQTSEIDRSYLQSIAASAESKSVSEADEYYRLNQTLTKFLNGDGKNLQTAEDFTNWYFNLRKQSYPDEPEQKFTNEGMSDLYTVDYDEKTDFFFGLEMKMNFMQSKNGVTTRGQDMVLKFAGDDDVWIYIDGVLFLDISGIHRHVGGEIDFYKGEVRYYDFADYAGNVQTTDSQIALTKSFETLLNEAGITDTSSILKSNGTFKDYSFHSMNFYYMERGSGSGICSLEFNMEQTLPTGIYKVDQYGDAIPDATFAAYSANENYWYKAADNKEPYYVNLKEETGYTIDETTGVIILKSGRKIEPRYVGVTDKGGQMTFIHKETENMGKPLSTAEIENLLGKNFILREVYIPPGYRTTAAEIPLKLENQLLMCDRTYDSGVWSSPNVLVTATRTLTKAADRTQTISYQNPETGALNGTLFAVVLKRNTVPLPNSNDDAIPFDEWYPIYGNDNSGYTQIDYTNSKYNGDQLKAAIDAAQMSQKYGNTIFSIGFQGTPQVTIENLPGNPQRYYTYMMNNSVPFTGSTDADGKVIEGTDLQYIIAYYWTDGTLEDATSANTYRIYSNGKDVSSNAFIDSWGSTIEVPNMENRLFFQKKSEENTLLSGAAFALYRAGENENGQMFYIADGQDGVNGPEVYLDRDINGDNMGTAKVNGTQYRYEVTTDWAKTDMKDGYIAKTGAGQIKITDNDGNVIYTVSPSKSATGESLTGYTHDSCSFITENGTGHFSKINEGDYVLREIKAPDGYMLNTKAEVKVKVTPDGVYANAGEVGDNVIVGNGAGYIASTLNTFASKGTIDETLTWIVTALRVKDGNTFADFDKPPTGEWNYATWKDGESQALASVSVNADGKLMLDTNPYLHNAMVTYLTFAPEASNVLFNYIPNEDQTALTRDNGTDDIMQAGQNTMRLFTDTGWSALAIYQDYLFGKKQDTTNSTTYYSDLSGQDLTNLFSNSTFIEITDNSIREIVLKKTDSRNNQVTLPDAEFALYKLENDVKYYYVVPDEDGVAQWKKANTDGTLPTESTLTTDSSGLLRAFRNTISKSR